MLISILGCSNNDDDASLPEATQTGENTAGCLVDGKVLLPKGSGLGGLLLRAFYQEIDANFHFGLLIANNTQNPQKYVNITISEKLIEVNSYNLKLRETNGGFFTSNFAEYVIGLRPDYQTTNNYQGEIIISKLDSQSKIVSGTFWFDALHENGSVVEVREGRFDMRYVN